MEQNQNSIITKKRLASSILKFFDNHVFLEL